MLLTRIAYSDEMTCIVHDAEGIRGMMRESDESRRKGGGF